MKAVVSSQSDNVVEAEKSPSLAIREIRSDITERSDISVKVVNTRTSEKDEILLASGENNNKEITESIVSDKSAELASEMGPQVERSEITVEEVVPSENVCKNFYNFFLD